MSKFIEKLGKELLFFDGGTGTMLQKRGLGAGELCEPWSVTRPDEIKGLHKSYLEAGCDIVKTNTFGANRLKLQDSGYTAEELITASLKLAREATEEAGGGYVAFDIGPSGKLLKPLGDLAFEDAYEVFAEMVRIAESTGLADLILIETMSDTYEMKAAILAARENSSLPIVATYAFDESGRLLTGADVECAAVLAESLGVAAVGFNCGLGPRELMPLIEKLKDSVSIPIVINPNAGLPVIVDGKTVFKVEPEEFGELMQEVAKSGAAIVGGCCGTTPEHIAAVKKSCEGIKITETAALSRTVVTSGSKKAVFGKKPVIIGERINPTGKKRLKQALLDKDMDYLLREAVSQTDAGADILDVNVGLPGINEPEMMVSAITAIQEISDLPLQIDTSDVEAMERALRIYNGKPLINSVNGKEESLGTVLPLAKKYGAAVVCLTLDEGGIPETCEGRIKIAEKIIKRAEEYGIDRKNLIIDALAMTVSTGSENANVTLDTLDYVRNKLGVHTVLGVSNVSFGLPTRSHINAAFFTMAMTRGLSAGIINPLSPEMMGAYRSYCALSGNDPDCGEYISYFAESGEPVQAAKSTESIDLKTAVVKGLKEQAALAAEAELKVKEPLEIIDGYLIPALDEVGKGFEEGRIFLPQLLISADSARCAFDVIKEHLQKSGEKADKGRIILATVKGDIHDIGKNIVKVLLENYGFDVIDLGKDVPPEVIVERAKAESIRLVGLSALMTTTVVAMEETIKLIKENRLDCKVMVGGAVLTQDYADSIGADFYSKDALGSVRYAEELFSK